MDVIFSEGELENVSQFFFLNVFPFRTRQFTSRKLIIYTNTDVPTDTQSDVHSGPFIIENTGSILNVPQQEAG